MFQIATKLVSTLPLVKTCCCSHYTTHTTPRMLVLLLRNDHIPSFTYSRVNYAATPGIASLGKASKKKMGKLGPVMEKKIMPVEEDANKLVNYVCGSNSLQEGEDIKLKPDEEYPEWLWTLRTGKAPPLHEMDPESKAYWLRVRTMGMKKNNRLAKLKRF